MNYILTHRRTSLGTAALILLLLLIGAFILLGPRFFFVFAQVGGDQSAVGGDELDPETLLLENTPTDPATLGTDARSRERREERDAPVKKVDFLDRLKIERILVEKGARSALSVSSYIDTGLADEASGAADPIADIKIYFHISNDSQERSLLTLNTGIPEGSLTYIRVEGATGYRWENGELVLAYIALPAGGSAMVTITALPLISDRPADIRLTPVLKDENGSVLARGTLEGRTVKAKLAAFIRGIRMGGAGRHEEEEILPASEEEPPIDLPDLTASSTELVSDQAASSSPPETLSQ